jgi:predicted dehydrogenase
MKQVGVGLYGDNGHQVTFDMIRQENARLIGVCQCQKTSYESSVIVFQTLEDLLSDPKINLVSVCSPMRREQAEDIKKILKNGKHVYAEKPCVMREEDLDEVLLLAEENKVIFCEMAGSMFDQPYNRVKQIVQEQLLGEVVQIFVQKSYPYADFRPQDENIDGGLILQNAIYGARFIEHIAGIRIADMGEALETSLGNPKSGDLIMASTLQMRLENGGIATVIANYLNQPGTKIWGNEELRIFGSKGYLKTNISDASVDLYTEKEQLHFETVEEPGLFHRLVSSIQKKEEFPYTAEYLTHPTRMVLRAKRGVSHV